jgi:hypothetical protein
MSPDAQTTIFGEVTDIFAHRFVVKTTTGKILADLGPKGAEHAMGAANAVNGARDTPIGAVERLAALGKIPGKGREAALDRPRRAQPAVGRAGSAHRSHHQPTAAVARNRPKGAPCATDHDQKRQLACPVGSRRQGASRRRTVLASPGPKCGAVDETATLAGNPRQSLPGLSQRQTFAPPAATRAKLTQLVIEKRQTQPSQSISTAVFRFNGSAIRNA